MSIKNNIILVLVFLLFFIQNLSVLGQSTGDFNNLQFHSAYEKSIFEKVLNHQAFDTVGLFMAIDKEISNEDVLTTKKKFFEQSDNFYNSYNKSKPQTKFIKDLFNFIHNSYLRKYDIDVYFNSIDKSGNYNCVTASAFYSIFFNRYNISYSIKEAPTHVYLIANPGTSNIMIETTSPTAGYFMPDEKFKRSYLDYLLENKSITKEEIANDGVSVAFEKNYYKQDEISVQELAALQYYNYGLSLIDINDFHQAFYQFTKAYFLYPSYKIKMMISATSADVISGSSLTDTADVNVYVSSYSYDVSAKGKDVFAHNFEVFTQKNLVEKNNLNYYESVYNRILNLVEDSLLRDRITFVYYSQLGRVEALNGNYDAAIPLLIKALKLNKEQKEVTSLIAASLIDRYVNTEKCAEVMISFTKENDFLLNKKRYNEAICYCYLRESGNYFAATNYSKAFEVLKRYEDFQGKHQVNSNAENVGFVYGNASSYYIRKGDYKTGRKYLLKGLKIAPSSMELNRKLSVLDNN